MQFIHLDLSKSLDSYVEKHTRTLRRRVAASHGRYKLSMSIAPESRGASSKVTSFVVHAELAIKGGSDLRVSKKSGSPEKAVIAAVEAIEKQLRVYSEMKQRGRKKLGKTHKPVRQLKYVFDLKSD